MDIYKRGELEQKLRDSPDLLAGIIASAMDAILVIDEAQRIVLFNTAAQKMFGCPADAAIGACIDRFIPQRFRAEYSKHVSLFEETGSSRNMGALGIWGLRSTGEEFPIEAAISKVEAGGTKFFAFVICDLTERYRAEEAVRESEERHRHLVESANDWVWEVDANVVYTYVGPQCRKILGYQAEEIIGKTPFDLMPPEEARRVVAVFAPIAAERKPFRGLENINRHKDGHLVSLETNGVPVINREGEFLGYRGMDRDITERKQAEERLREYERVIQGLGERIAVVDREYRYVIANRAFLQYRGLETGQVVGRFVPEVVGKELFESVIKKDMDECFQGKVVQYELKYSYTTLGERDLFVSYFPIEGPTGVTRIAIVLQDITERKRAEEELRESEARYEQLAEQSRTTNWEMDPQGLFTYVSHVSEASLGYRPDEVVGRMHVYDLNPEEGREAFKAAVFAVVERKQPFRDVVHAVETKDGRISWSSTNGIPMLNADGTLRGYRGSCTDITERKLAEAALANVSRKLIEAQEQERVRIGRDLHDDIGQRLAMAAIELQQLHEDPLVLRKVRRRMGRLQNQISEIAADTQSLSHELHSVNLQYVGIAAAVRGFCRKFGKQQKVEIDFKTHDLPSPVSPDISLCFFRVLQEALHNAAKHSGVRHIEVRLWGTSDEIHLTVKDSGAGFEREAAKESRGLGLISMEERLKLVKGTLSINSQPKGGTTIHARVPFDSSSDSVRAAG